MPECRTDRHTVSQVPEGKKLTMQEPVRYRTNLMQSGIFFIPVPDINHGCQNTDAGVSFHDADAQLCLLGTVHLRDTAEPTESYAFEG